MSASYTYLLVNACTIAIPFAFTFHPRLAFHRTWHAFWPACLATAAVFIAWDVWFTDLGVWGFNPDYLVGVSILNLPLEEWLFFVCIPYACTFTYACLKKLIARDLVGPAAPAVTWALIVLLVVVAALAGGRLYTTVTFVLTAACLLVHALVLRADYLGRFYFAYAVIFAFPFLVTNGILTGSFIDEPVVWYDNDENLAIRAFTIPVEDFVYGLLLYLMNVTLYESFLARRRRAEADRA